MVRNVVPISPAGPILQVVTSGHNPSGLRSSIPFTPSTTSVPLRRRGLEPAMKAMDELEGLIGLRRVKDLIFEVAAFCQVQRYRERAGLKVENPILHMVFKGNPGTGKTTVARIMGRIFKELGVLEIGHVVEVERADLVGEYIGHTAQKTREQIRKALGGILFIDEAYSLARGGEKDFGRECIDCLVKAMEDHGRETVFILAGYPSEMEMFLQMNPGLRSRFPIQLEFPDYTVEELLAIARVMFKDRDYYMTSDAAEVLGAILRERAAREAVPSNARLVRNIVEKAMRRQAVRLVKRGTFGRQELVTIGPEEILEAASGA
ncbi:MAG TPA: AAA family ATPase [Firmicutes bacterium]|nr:AAA family ATPase [Candidatus Fermentithermobacillaceae bacterium]